MYAFSIFYLLLILVDPFLPYSISLLICMLSSYTFLFIFFLLMKAIEGVTSKGFSIQIILVTSSLNNTCDVIIAYIFTSGRQLVTFLLFANITLWVLDTFMTHNWITQALQVSISPTFYTKLLCS